MKNKHGTVHWKKAKMELEPMKWEGDVPKLEPSKDAFTIVFDFPKSHRIYNKWYKEVWWWIKETFTKRK